MYVPMEPGPTVKTSVSRRRRSIDPGPTARSTGVTPMWFSQDANRLAASRGGHPE